MTRLFHGEKVALAGWGCYTEGAEGYGSEGWDAMPKTKWIIALLSCLLLAGGAFYWQNEGQRAPAEIGRSAVTQAALPEEALQNPPKENEDPGTAFL